MYLFIFFRGKGPLKNASDVISAAKKIAEAGSRMDKLGRAIADQVSWTLKSVLQEKKDLFSVNYPCACFSLKDLNPYEASSETLPVNSFPWLFPAPFENCDGDHDAKDCTSLQIQSL